MSPRTAESVTRELTRRGDLWQHAPGLVGLRGDTLRLFRALESEVARVVSLETDDEWAVPPAIAFETLARADYFASFPAWLTAAAHLDADDATLEAVATADEPAVEALRALRPVPAALQPAVCYHVYAALRGRTLPHARVLTTQGTCWRQEGDRLAPLERGWAFTMRELVCIGSASDVQRFCERGRAALRSLALRLGLEAEFVIATDPFYAPTARGRALLQRAKGLKHELTLPIGGGRSVAAASVNDHERFFGEAFDIRLTNGSAASSGCVAFGLERWLLAFLIEHGCRAENWPAVDAAERQLELGLGLRLGLGLGLGKHRIELAERNI